MLSVRFDLTMAAASAPEMSVNVYQIARRNVPEDSHLQSGHRDMRSKKGWLHHVRGMTNVLHPQQLRGYKPVIRRRPGRPLD
jgi:hypothetical protein